MLPVHGKFVPAFVPAAKTNNGTVAANVIDCQGFRYLEVYVQLGTTDIAVTALQLQESDVKASATALTGGTVVPGTNCGTDVNTDTGATSVLPLASNGGTTWKFEVDLKGRKRFVLPVVTVGNGSTGAFVSVLAILTRGENEPTTAAQKNVAQVQRVPGL